MNDATELKTARDLIYRAKNAISDLLHQCSFLTDGHKMRPTDQGLQVALSAYIASIPTAEPAPVPQSLDDALAGTGAPRQGLQETQLRVALGVAYASSETTFDQMLVSVRRLVARERNAMTGMRVEVYRAAGVPTPALGLCQNSWRRLLELISARAGLPVAHVRVPDHGATLEGRLPAGWVVLQEGERITLVTPNDKYQWPTLSDMEHLTDMPGFKMLGTFPSSEPGGAPHVMLKKTKK